MYSLVRSNRLLLRNAFLVKEMKRWIRYEPLVIDKPPDYYQTIEQKLNAINYHENCNHLVDIGLTEDSPLRQRWLQVSQDIKAKSQRVKEDSEDSEEVDKSLDYKQIYRKWLLSEEGIRSTVDLANHYAIFRDLFPVSPPLQSVSAIEVMPQTPVYYFSPLVSLNAEFCVLESEVEEKDAIDKNSEEMAENQSNDIIVSPVFRGNIIFPQKCFNCPNVTIDSSAINGINSSDNCDTSEVSDEELSGRIRLLNDGNHYYTLCLISLDSHLGHESNVCHWMATNIHNKNKVTTHETVVQYLPVYGIRGLGYQRFVFMLYKHKNPLNLPKVDDFDLKNRSFNAYEFMSAHGTDNSLTPVGLSWFQTTWDYSSRKIYYDFLNMRCPHYEWIAPKNTSFKQLQFPARAPFNIYLDNFRDPKEMAKDVLLERLKSVNPYDYEKEFDKPRLPNIHPFPRDMPSWVRASVIKKRGKIGIYRGLRPHSAIEPFDNNADLDRPKWPRIHESVQPLNMPLPYPDGHRRPKPLRDTEWVKPPHEHPTYRIAFPQNLDESDRKNLREEDSSSN